MPFEQTDSKTDAVRVFKSRISKLETEQGRIAGLSLKPQPGDVFIVTPPKCGTTWVGQIVQTLRTGGDMDFDELNVEIPCLEMAFDSGLTNIDVPQRVPLRVFKTHSWYRDCPKGGKYIFVTRDPKAAGLSFYNFMAGWFFQRDEMPMEAFLEEFWLARSAPETNMQNASHWHNMASWYPHRNDPNVLWLHYEDLQQNLPAAVALIAEFIGAGHDDPELQKLACHQASLEEMQKNMTKYDEHHLKLARNEACGLPRDAGLGDGGTAKIRKASSGKQERLSDKLLEQIANKWETVMVPATGYTSYEEMRKGINAELKRPF